MYTYQIKTLHFEPSQLCNASCPVCNRRVSGGPKNPHIKDVYSSYDQVKEWFNPDFINNLDRLILCGNYGDPMTNPDLLKIIAYFRTHSPNLYITMHTNASGKNKKWWNDLGNLIGKNGEVFFSIDGLSDTNHIYRRGTHWDMILEAIEGYISSGANAVWDYLIFRHNEHQVEEAKKLSEQLGFTRFIKKSAFGFQSDEPIIASKHTGEFDYFIYPRGSTVNKEPIEYKVDPEFIFDKDSTAAILEVDSIILEKFDNVEIECMAAKESEIYVNAYGLLFPCCFTAGKYQSDRSFVNAQFREFVNKFSEDSINLNKYELENIIKNKMFTDAYPASWNCSSIETGKLFVCAEFCGKYKQNTFHKILDDLR